MAVTKLLTGVAALLAVLLLLALSVICQPDDALVEDGVAVLGGP